MTAFLQCILCAYAKAGERVKAGVFEKLSRVELSMEMFECRYALPIQSARETPVSRTMVARSRKKTVSTKEKCMFY